MVTTGGLAGIGVYGDIIDVFVNFLGNEIWPHLKIHGTALDHSHLLNFTQKSKS